MSRRRRLQAGFTLIELLVVITLIMILAGISVAVYQNSIQSSKEAVLKTNLTQVRDAIDQYYADKGKYPASLETLVSERYLREIPMDPIARATDRWIIEMAPPDASTQTGSPGVYNIRSGADGTALDGTRYRDW
jgi:general secretion pathway protein G